MLYEIFTIGNIEWKFMRICLFVLFVVVVGFFLLHIYKVSCSVRQVTQMVFQWRSLFRHIHISVVLWFFQAVHLTHEWMEEKLQTYFRMDTGCPNHNTSMKNCKFSLFTRSPSSYEETFFKSLTDHLNITRYQIMMKCWKNDPDARPPFTEFLSWTR